MSHLKSTGLPPDKLKRIVECIQQVPGVTRILLFGSRALGNFREGSDIDIAIEGHSICEKDMSKLFFQLDDLMFPEKIDLLLVHQIDNPALLEHIRRHGIALYDKHLA